MKRRFLSARALPALILVFAGALLVGTAYGPGNIAAAFGMHRTPAPAGPVGYAASPVPVRVQSPTLRLTGLEKLSVGVPVPLSDGTMSPPDTVYLRFDSIELDDLSISQQQPDYGFVLANKGSGRDTAVIGNPASVSELWGRVSSLKLCVTPQTLYTVVTTYAGVFGGGLDGLLKLIGDIFAPFANSPLGPVGPCLPLTALLPVLNVLIDHGVPLPEILPAADLDIYVYALNVTTDPGKPSVTLPKAEARVTRR